LAYFGQNLVAMAWMSMITGNQHSVVYVSFTSTIVSPARGRYTSKNYDTGRHTCMLDVSVHSKSASTCICVVHTYHH